MKRYVVTLIIFAYNIHFNTLMSLLQRIQNILCNSIQMCPFYVAKACILLL